MRPMGFSTGALAKGDFDRGIALQRNLAPINAIELSALREHELPALVEASHSLDLARFRYVSFHAPSKLREMDERTALELLSSLPEAWPIVVHPEIIGTPSLWAVLGSRLCLENMDNRKSGGRTVNEMSELFGSLPHATFCLDVGHAKQIDPTMATAILMLKQFGDRLKQVHVSDVGPNGEHSSIGILARLAFGRVAAHVPEDCPLIIESVIPASQMSEELAAVSETFAGRVSAAFVHS